MMHVLTAVSRNSSPVPATRTEALVSALGHAGEDRLPSLGRSEDIRVVVRRGEGESSWLRDAYPFIVSRRMSASHTVFYIWSFRHWQ